MSCFCSLALAFCQQRCQLQQDLDFNWAGILEAIHFRVPQAQGKIARSVFTADQFTTFRSPRCGEHSCDRRWQLQLNLPKWNHLRWFGFKAWWGGRLKAFRAGFYIPRDGKQADFYFEPHCEITTRRQDRFTEGIPDSDQKAWEISPWRLRNFKWYQGRSWGWRHCFWMQRHRPLQSFSWFLDHISTACTGTNLLTFRLWCFSFHRLAPVLQGYGESPSVGKGVFGRDINCDFAELTSGDQVDSIRIDGCFWNNPC